MVVSSRCRSASARKPACTARSFSLPAYYFNVFEHCAWSCASESVDRREHAFTRCDECEGSSAVSLCDVMESTTKGTWGGIISY